MAENKRLMTDVERKGILTREGTKRMLAATDPYGEYEIMKAERQDRKTLKAVGEWLSTKPVHLADPNHEGQGATRYVLLPENEVAALKRGIGPGDEQWPEATQ